MDARKLAPVTQALLPHITSDSIGDYTFWDNLSNEAKMRQQCNPSDILIDGSLVKLTLNPTT